MYLLKARIEDCFNEPGCVPGCRGGPEGTFPQLLLRDSTRVDGSTSTDTLLFYLRLVETGKLTMRQGTKEWVVVIRQS